MSKVKSKLSAGEALLKNPKHELFCWLYAGSHNRELFGNGKRCYIQVYFSTEILKLKEEILKLANDTEKGYSRLVLMKENRIKSLEHQASVRATELVANRSLKARIDFLLLELISHDFMDRELAFTAAQRNDLNSKVQAIKEYNRMTDRGSKGNLEGNFTFSWEDEPESKPGVKKRPVLKKAEVKVGTDVEWEGDK
ncbi:MAG: hypothetical protein RBG13Loki_0368 [Promethearchaeota archaeon CR_4]|nr:MAG: hypothetical protein RBG13Loki_0368 [Candidatus Lokiarchaeota archaeon CR_4]